MGKPYAYAGTALAIDNAEAHMSDGLKDAMCRFMRDVVPPRPDFRDRPLLRPWPNSSLSTSVFELHPRLEMTVLRHAGLITAGCVTLQPLFWSADIALAPSVTFMVANLSVADFPYIAVQTDYKGEMITQIITLAKDAQDCWRFLCPVTNKRPNVLAFRGGRWASKSAQRLKNVSQRSFRFQQHARMGARNDRLDGAL